MFKETREMLDSTIYTNGRSELGAKNVNLAMHGILDAAEGKFTEVDEEMKQNDAKITEIKQDITKLSESGLGGLTLKYPLIFLQEVVDVQDLVDLTFDREIAQEIVAELPALATAVEELFAHNSKTLEAYRKAIDEGKTAPIITIDVLALYYEFAAIEEGVSIDGLTSYVLPSMVQQQGHTIVTIASIGTEYMSFAFTPNGIFAPLYETVAYIYIPMPNAGTIDNSDNLFALKHDNRFNLNTYYYVNEGRNQDVTPVHFKYSELQQNLLIRFVVDTDLLEAIINIETGLTRSRVIAKLPAEEVGIIPEGTLERANNLAYPYYEILPAEGGAVVSLSIKANVDWMLYDHDHLLKSGVAGATTYEYAVGQNTSTEPYNHNYRLVAASDEEELATLWIAQDAAAATIEEPVNEE